MDFFREGMPAFLDPIHLCSQATSAEVVIGLLFPSQPKLLAVSLNPCSTAECQVFSKSISSACHEISADSNQHRSKCNLRAS